MIKKIKIGQCLKLQSIQIKNPGWENFLRPMTPILIVREKLLIKLINVYLDKRNFIVKH